MSHETPDIPAHNTRHDMAIIGAKEVGGILRIALRIDNGCLKGKKMSQTFRSVHPREKESFADAIGASTHLWGAGIPAWEDWINEHAPAIRVSANVKKEIKLWDPKQEVWKPVDTPPAEEAKFKYEYRLTEFDEPEQESELRLAESFHQRRQRVEESL